MASMLSPREASNAGARSGNSIGPRKTRQAAADASGKSAGAVASASSVELLLAVGVEVGVGVEEESAVTINVDVEVDSEGGRGPSCPPLLHAEKSSGKKTVHPKASRRHVTKTPRS
jgi:hypothetical protein